MNMKLRRQEVTVHAETLVSGLGISELPVNPFAIAHDRQIEIQPKDSDEPGVSGFLARTGSTFGIMYATHIKNEGFINFTVSHELGHYFLPGHPEHLFPYGDGVHKSRSGFISRDPYELEADHFASTLLMPTSLFLPAIRDAGDGFEAIQSLAEACKTSITATAIRYAAHAEDPVAVILSSGDRIDACFVSDPIKDVKGLRWFIKNEIVPTGTATRTFNQDPGNIDLCNTDQAWTTLDLWFDGSSEIEMQEDVVGLGSYGKTLTVLFTTEAIETED
jgi:IrrE N-terminal-like domain